MNYLAFDVGASSGKMFVGHYDGERLMLCRTHRFVNSAVERSGELFWDYDSIFSNMLDGIKKSISAVGKLRSFGVDSFSNDYSFIGKDGGIISPMYCYRDARTARCRERIFEKLPPERIYRESGNQIALFTTLMQLASMRVERRDEVFNRAAGLLFLPDLLCYQLTGRAACEYTIATVSQLFDYDGGGWNDRLLSAFDIPRRLMPEIVKPASLLGKATLPGLDGLPVVSVCEHDTASAYLAAGATKHSAIISSGTWALVGVENDCPIINDTSLKYNIANEGSLPGKHRLLKNVMGSWLIQKLLAAFTEKGEAYSFADISILAEKAEPFAFLIDPDAEAFFRPADILMDIRQNGKGARMPETIGEYARCIYESLAFKYRWCIEKLETLVGRRLDSIRIVGGGAQDETMNRFIANACERPVCAGCADASAAGNILVQMMADGQLADIAQAAQLLERSFNVTVFEPERASELGKRYYEYLNIFGLE